MKRWLLVVLAIIAIPRLFPPTLNAETIRLRADLWCPYNCEPGDELEGYMIDVARRLFGRAGHSVDYQTLNWARSIQMAKEGRIHGIIGAGKDETPDFVFPDLEIGLIRNTFFVRKDDGWRFAGIPSLRNKRLGVIVGYGYGTRLDKYIQQHRKTDRIQLMAGNEALQNNIQKLLGGRVDVVLEDNAVFHHVSRQMGVADRIQEAGDDQDRGSVNNLYIAFSPSLPESKLFARILSDGIAEMRRTGELSEILSRYGLEDWQTEIPSR